MTTEEQTALRAMTEAEIRRAQDLVRLQIPVAHAQRNTTALERLQAWEDSYASEMMRRLEA